MPDTKIGNLTPISTPLLDTDGVAVHVDAADSTEFATVADLKTAINPTDIEVFTDITDVPDTYVDQAGKSIYVNGTEDGLVFAGLKAYGNSYVRDNAVPQATTTDWTEIIPVGLELGVYSNVTVDEVLKTMTILVPGVYSIDIGISFTGGNNVTYDFAIYVNDVSMDEGAFSRRTGSSDVGNVSCHTILRLEAGDLVTSYVKSSTASTLTMVHGQFNLIKIDD